MSIGRPDRYQGFSLLSANVRKALLNFLMFQVFKTKVPFLVTLIKFLFSRGVCVCVIVMFCLCLKDAEILVVATCFARYARLVNQMV